MVKILLVDDSRLIIKVLTEYINELNPGVPLEVFSALDGEEAVQKFKETNPDLVFLDIKMPGMDGLTALHQIKMVNKEAKVVMCTSLTQDDTVKKAVSEGAVDYITKPFGRDNVKRVLHDQLGGDW